MITINHANPVKSPFFGLFAITASFSKPAHRAKKAIFRPVTFFVITPFVREMDSNYFLVCVFAMDDLKFRRIWGFDHARIKR